jgi:demethylmenaquinone methyltransferase/2-methoxy-6-polyprenyl-1,4-benzoquinol methylase
MKADRNTTRANYDRLSRWYDLFSASSERTARLHGLQMLDVHPGERALEIGCGTGESLLTLASEAGSAGRVLGLDLSAGMLKIVINKLEKGSAYKITLVQGNGLCLPFPERSFDAILMNFTLELFSAFEIPCVLRECMRVLHSDGRMGITALLQKEKPGWMERAYTWAHHRWPLIIDCRPIPLEELVKSAGFEISCHSEMSMWGLAVGIFIVSKN